jgi:NAD(P)-dependent dehydrogenase (short-subunit alcohol dehydrogenase family)
MPTRPASRTRSDEAVRLLVVGGSSGIGRAVATQAAHDGHDVTVAARRTVEDLNCITLDVRDEGSIARGFETIGTLDAVLYAAGIAQLAALGDHSADDWRATLETNLIGAALVAKHAVPLLSASNGVMIFFSSTTDDEHRWGLGSYGVSKAGLNRLVDGLRAEHPDVRFVRATLGPTVGTAFAEGWDSELLGDAFNKWIERGQHTANTMSTDGLAQVVVSLITSLLAHPDVAMPILHLEPPGGPFSITP